MSSLSILFCVNEICSEELLSLTDSRADGSPAKHKAQHLGCHKPCNELTALRKKSEGYLVDSSGGVAKVANNISGRISKSVASWLRFVMISHHLVLVMLQLGYCFQFGKRLFSNGTLIQGRQTLTCERKSSIPRWSGGCSKLPVRRGREKWVCPALRGLRGPSGRV